MKITPKVAQHIMRILKLSEIRLPIADTTKGHLAMQIRWEEHDFNFILDAVPVSDEHNKALKHILLNDGLEQDSFSMSEQRRFKSMIEAEDVSQETPKVEVPANSDEISTKLAEPTHEELPEGKDEPDQSELDGKGEETIPNNQEKE